MEGGIEGYFVSKILEFEKRRYVNGLFGDKGLFINKQRIKSVINSDGIVKSYKYDVKTKEVSCKEPCRKAAVTYSFDSQNYGTLDMHNNGMRWEGIVVNGHPFGYGSLYNDDNELTYRGVMIVDKKEGFGIDFYPGLGMIEYCGCYCNNERHGFGMLYDRKGELIYEGDFICGSSYSQKRNNELNEKMRVNNIDDPCVHSLIGELIVGEGCDCGSHKVGSVYLFPYLESLVIEKNALQNLHSLKVYNLPQLKRFETGDKSFINTKSLSLESMMIDD